ncbi:MAG: VTT domain-containing protein [archaeon]|nr:VTT domain-containing protein [archaeon]
MIRQNLDTVKSVIAIIGFLIVAYLIFTNASVVNQLILGYGLVGLLIAAMIANASIFLPVPIDLVIFALSAESANYFDVVVISIVAGIGAAIGEMTAYIMGLLGVKTAEKAKHKEFLQMGKVREKLGTKGMVFIFLGAMTPFPFDLIGIVAGLIKYDVKKFFVAALAGKILRYLIIGAAAYYGLSFAKDLFFI